MTISEFELALNEASLITNSKIIADGRVQRFWVHGDKKGTKNGWYVLFSEGGIQAGAFGSWKTGEKHTWCFKSERLLSHAERQVFKRKMGLIRQEHAAELAKRQQDAAQRALYIWKSSSPATPDHTYLVDKCVNAHGIRLYKDCLVVPMRDIRGHLHSLQFIDRDGNKRFLSGGRKKGCYFLIGTPRESVCIAEGYSTAATIYESTGQSVAISFDAGNLESVAKAIRSKFPDIGITLCADNDEDTKGNPGLTKAREAAASVGGLLAVPPICGDFNDYYNTYMKEGHA